MNDKINNSGYAMTSQAQILCLDIMEMITSLACVWLTKINNKFYINQQSHERH